MKRKAGNAWGVRNTPHNKSKGDKTMRSLKDWTLRDMEIYNQQHKHKAWLATVTFKEAKSLFACLGPSRLEFRRAKFYNGIPLVDVYLKGYTTC